MIATITLPWPDKRLSPNARQHWSNKARAVRRARHAAQALALEAGIRRIEDKALNVSVTFHAPDNRRRDTDNAISSLKASMDGIADVVGVDDSRWRLSFEWGEVRKGGAVEIKIQRTAEIAA